MKRVVALMRRGMRVAEPRNFHETRCFYAKPRPSPRVVRASQQSQRIIRVEKTYGTEDSLPPINLIDAARKSGALKIETDKALEFLRSYHKSAPTAGWEKTLCAEHNVSPFTMALLAAILKRCSAPAQKLLAKKLLLSASELGEKAATFDLIQEALRGGMIHEYPVVVKRLGDLALGNDPQAQLLLGKILFMDPNAEKKALSWLQKATKPPTGSLEFDGAGEALVLEGRILLKMKKKEEATAVFKQAALELDEPEGYFYLSKLQDPTSTEHQIYLLKAATSGIVEASHNLGVVELEKLVKSQIKPKSLDDYGVARDWFEVAAADGFGLSMLNMASMCKQVADVEAAIVWLSKAEQAASTTIEARKLRRQWESDESRQTTIS